MSVHVPQVVWNVIFAVAVLAAIVVGFPFLLGGGGRFSRRRRGGRYGRRGDRIRVGPHPALMLARHADTLLLLAATVVFVVAVTLNARG